MVAAARKPAAAVPAVSRHEREAIGSGQSADAAPCASTASVETVTACPISMLRAVEKRSTGHVHAALLHTVPAGLTVRHQSTM